MSHLVVEGGGGCALHSKYSCAAESLLLCFISDASTSLESQSEREIWRKKEGAEGKQKEGSNEV